MQQFSDAKNHVWDLSITYEAVKRAKAAGINLGNPNHGPDGESVMECIVSDPTVFWEALYAVVQPQLKLYNVVGLTDFVEQVRTGPKFSLLELQSKFLEEWRDFFRWAGADLTAEAIELVTTRLTAANRQMQSQLAAEQAKDAATSANDKSSGTPASSE